MRIGILICIKVSFLYLFLQLFCRLVGEIVDKFPILIEMEVSHNYLFVTLQWRFVDSLRGLVFQSWILPDILGVNLAYLDVPIENVVVPTSLRLFNIGFLEEYLFLGPVPRLV